ncbi:zinc finger (Ran-binding) family protein [Rhynchospora pubera]|uniref:Zinc finger (Ran-binding) family protein n=1 Tax=Rhynchospora pubera TaxID=906938 RepID=A0AAV8DGG4_9POAL|nr:zinc finger (Ran-binding) family protein [Rhynchospora pubera]
MATSASLSLLLRHRRTTAFLLLRRLSSLPLSSSTPSSDSIPNPSSDSKPPSLSSRLSFVFDQLDSLSEPPDLSEQESALRRIRSWRHPETPPPEKEEEEEKAEPLIQNPKEKTEAASMAEVLKKEVELVHPWPEWIQLMERLATLNYFDLRRADEQRVADDVAIDLSEVKEEVSLDLSRDWLTVRNACMNFGRDRFDIIRSLQRKDIQTLVGHGCPSMDPKVIFSAKLLRKLVHLDEGDVCSTCSLRNSCSRGYILVPKEDQARTLDVMRVLLTFGFDHANGTVENKDLMKLKQVKNVVRKLMHEVARLSAVPIDPRLPPPVMKKKEVKVKQPPPPPKKRRVGRDDVEMKKGDWLCPKCDFMNFAKNTVCMQCDAKRPKRQLLPGEWECPRCKFLNYRRNMACYECEHKRPPDEYTSIEMESRYLGPTRTRSERGTPTRVPEVSDAWNFDFDDNESDGADVAAFEFADSSKRGLEEGDIKGSRGRRLDMHERKPTPYSSRTGFDDFDDEDDDLDSYEIDPSGGKRSGVARRSFSELEESDLDDYEDFDRSKKNSDRRSRNYLAQSDNDDDGPYFQNRNNVLKSDSDSDYDDGFRSYNPRRSQRASYNDFESDGDDYVPSTKNNLKGGKSGPRGHSGRAKETNQSRRYGKVHDQDNSWGQIRRKGGRFGNDGFRGSHRKEMRNSDRFDRRDDIPYKADESTRLNSRYRR